MAESGESDPGVVARFRLAAVVGIVTVVAYSTLAVRAYRQMDVQSWDLAIFEQAVRNLAHGHAPTALIKGTGYNLFGDHFHPILVLLVPAYWLHGSAVTLLIAQALLFGLAAFVVTRTAVGLLGEYWGLCIGLSFAFAWALQAAVIAQFHEIAFGVPLMALALSRMVQRRWLACALWAAPLVFVKEDLGLTVAALGFLVLVRSRGKALRIGAGMVVWGLVWFVLAVKVFLPLFNPQSQWDYANRVDWVHYLSHPWLMASAFVDPRMKLWTLIWIFLITGLLALRSSITLAVLPTLTWRFLSANDAYWGMYWHYNAILMPIVFVAMIDVARRIRSDGWKLTRWYAQAAVPGALLLALVLPWVPNPYEVKASWKPASWALARIQVPIRPLLFLSRPDFYQPSPRTEPAGRILNDIPDGACVEASKSMMAYLTYRDDVYYPGRPGNPPPDYVLVDKDLTGMDATPADTVAYAEQLHPGTVYRLVAHEGPFVLVARQR